MPRSSTSHSHGPNLILSLASLVALVALTAFLWCAYDSYTRFSSVAERAMRVQELRGEIIHLDEALTMSARMCALTGDQGWEARYRTLEPQLDAAIGEVKTSAVGAATTAETESANAALVELENRAFEQSRRGELEGARATLFSEEYARHKAVYSAGMAALGRGLDEAMRAAMHRERKRVWFQLIAGGVVIALLLVGWVVVVRFAHQAAAARGQLDKIERDLSIAREIQRGLLPTEAADAPGFEIEGWSKPADQTGGDYFDWMKLPDGGILITLADVSGHGIGPALIVAVCRAYMRASASGVSLEAAIARVNDLLQSDIPTNRFVTAAVGVLRPELHEMALVSAGQAPLIFYRASSRTVETWTADDLPLGIVPGLELGSARSVRFEPGDALVLTTDGFFEWANHAGEQFGIARLEAFVGAHAHETPARFIEALHASVVEHAAGAAQPDDLTAVIVKRKAHSSGDRADRGDARG